MRSLWLSSSCLVFALVGCGPPSPKEVAEKTGQRTARLLRGAGDAARAVEQLEAFSTLTNGFNAMTAGFSAVPVNGSCPPGGCTTAAPAQKPSAPSEKTVNESTDKFIKLLQDRVFTDANVESRDGDAVIFRLMGDDICTDGTYPPNDDCVSTVNKLELRVRADPAPGDALDLTVLIGSPRFMPATFLLRPTSIAVQSDLEQLKSAIEYVASQQGQSVDLPRVMEGKVELKLEENGQLDYTVSSSVLKDVRVEVVDGLGRARSFRTAAKAPLAFTRIEGLTKRFTYALDVGPTAYSAPYTDVAASGLAGKVITFDVAGLSMEFSAQQGQKEAVIAHVGLGDARSTVTLDQTTLFTADLNPGSNRHFDLKLTPDSDGQPLVQVVPELDLATRFFLRPLKVDSSQNIPSHFEDETYTVKLVGPPAPQVKPVNAFGAFPGGFKVLAGTLTLDSDKAQPVVVATGQCLVGRKTLPAGAHPLLGYLEAVACP